MSIFAYTALSKDGRMTSGTLTCESRAAALSYNITHDNEMAGTAYVYMRAKGLVPPSMENAPARGGGGAGRGAAPTPGF